MLIDALIEERGGPRRTECDEGLDEEDKTMGLAVDAALGPAEAGESIGPDQEEPEMSRGSTGPMTRKRASEKAEVEGNVELFALGVDGGVEVAKIEGALKRLQDPDVPHYTPPWADGLVDDYTDGQVKTEVYGAKIGIGLQSADVGKGRGGRGGRREGCGVGLAGDKMRAGRGGGGGVPRSPAQR